LSALGFFEIALQHVRVAGPLVVGLLHRRERLAIIRRDFQQAQIGDLSAILVVELVFEDPGLLPHELYLARHVLGRGNGDVEQRPNRGPFAAFGVLCNGGFQQSEELVFR
jgi:hypothetical protein